MTIANGILVRRNSRMREMIGGPWRRPCRNSFALAIALSVIFSPVKSHGHPRNGATPASASPPPCPCQGAGCNPPCAGQPLQNTPSQGAPNPKPADANQNPPYQPPTYSPCPIYYRYGAAVEKVVDLELPASAFGWKLQRTYASNLSGTTTQGNKWFSSAADIRVLYGGMLLSDAMSGIQFTENLTTLDLTPPPDTTLMVSHDRTNKQYIFTDQFNNLRWRFNDLAVVTTTGNILEQSTLQWYTQGNSGYSYTWGSADQIQQITTPTGQDYNIVFTTNTNNYITQIQVKDASSTVQAQVNYTYYQDVSGASTDLGTTNDLVQVSVSTRATTDTGSTLSIVRYTQYRYNGTTSNLKAVYENDAIQRLLASTGLSSPNAIMQQADTYTGSGSTSIKGFASRSFTYYGSSPPSATNVSTPFAAKRESCLEIHGQRRQCDRHRHGRHRNHQRLRRLRHDRFGHEELLLHEPPQQRY
jgi:hypothetical protein